MENTKGKGWITASKLIGYIGVAICLIAAAVHITMYELGYKFVFMPDFAWEHIYILGGAAAAIIVIAVVLRLIGVAAAKDVVEEVEEVVEEEPAVEAAPVATNGKIELLTPEAKELITKTIEENKKVIVAVAVTFVVTAGLSKLINDSKRGH
jgi:hypothetical protein